MTNSTTLGSNRSKNISGHSYYENPLLNTPSSDFLNEEIQQFEGRNIDLARSSSNLKSMERLPSVLKRTGLSRSSIYNLLNPRHSSYDPSFPEQVQLSRNIVAWDSEEITAWLESKITAQKQRKELDDF